MGINFVGINFVVSLKLVILMVINFVDSKQLALIITLNLKVRGKKFSWIYQLHKSTKIDCLR